MRYREQRLPCDTEVLATFGEEVGRVRFVNVSGTGARMTGLGRLPPNTLVKIRHLSDSFSARIVWATEAQAGVRFVRPLSGSELSRLRGTGQVPGGAWNASRLHGFRELT